MHVPVVISFATKGGGEVWRGGRTLTPRTKTQPPTNVATTAHKKKTLTNVKALPKLVSLPYARGGWERWSNARSPHKNATTYQRRNHCAQKKTLTNVKALPVRGVGLEPTRLSPPDPKSGAATNYAISALDDAKVKKIFNFKHNLTVFCIPLSRCGSRNRD